MDIYGIHKIFAYLNSLDIERKRRFNINVKGVMIGRALFGNPFQFLEFHEDFDHPSLSKGWESLWQKNARKHSPPRGSFRFKPS